MRTYNSLYTTSNDLSSWVADKNFNHEYQIAVAIHSSNLSADECIELAKKIKSLLPTAVVNGCSVSGIIYNGEIHNSGTLISIREFEHGKVLSRIQSTLGLSAEEVAQAIARTQENFPTSFATLNFDNLRHDIMDIAKHLSALLPDVTFVGGVAGTMQENGEVDSFLFDENAYYRRAFLVNYVSNDFVLSYSDITIGHPPISEVFTITKAHDEYIDEIDGIPALQWFSQKYNLNDFSENNDWNNTVSTDILLRFPLVFEDYSSSTCFIQYEKETNQIRSYYTILHSGQKFRIGYISPIKSAEELQETCYNLQIISAEMIFCYSCLFRNLLANSIARWELSVFKNSQICGAFMLGEIGTKNGQVQLLNGSASFFTLGEKSEHIETDLSVFESLDNLLEANDDFIRKIKAVSANLNSTIFTSLINQEEEIKDRLSFETEDNLKSIPQFLKQQTENLKDEICLVSIEDFEKHHLLLGDEEFEILAKENRQRIINFLKKNYPRYRFNFYRYDSAHFFFTIEEQIGKTSFVAILRNLQANCGNGNFLNGKVACFNTFNYTLNGLAIQQLLDFSRLDSLPTEERRFHHCDKEDVEIKNLNDEFQMVAALNKIIQDEAVVPYFQGIYDNRKNCFHMYEALMRLQHPNGKMLFPGDFMDIAKKYDLYLPLSICMVSKVFSLFRDRHEIITLNISAHDILSESFKNNLFKHLKELPNPQNYVFELLETEKFTDLETLRSFIHRVKQYGCKFAVDDFGAGYSNFIEFGNLDVDYLKINGSLTKLLGTDFNYEHILNSIAFMGEKMKVRLIAEFVETASTQKLLIQSGVHFSQGYFFSKPMPFDELKIVSKENTTHCERVAEEQEEAKNIPLMKDKAKQESLLLYIGGILAAFLTIAAVAYFVNYNRTEFKKINDSFLVEIATGISDKVSLFVEESKISLQLMSVAMSEYGETLEDSYSDELLDLSSATEFSSVYVSYKGAPAVNAHNEVLDVPINQIYGQAVGHYGMKLPIAETSTGEKVLIFASCLNLNGKKVGEIYGTYQVSELAKLLNLKSFGGEAFYHISQVDGEPIHLSGRTENAFKDGDMYTFIGSLDIFNGHTAESIKQDMYDSKTVLLNYYLGGEERSAVMVRIPHTDWCIVSIVLNEINTKMLKSSNQGLIIFISFISFIYLVYFAFVTRIFKKHKDVILETLEASQALSSSLQLSIEKDSLTGTYSRATAIEKISDVISTKNQKGIVHALAILDIDNFKYINDTYGHHTGDLYLQSFVSAVKHGIRPGSILGRLGGDEFLLLLSDIEDIRSVKAAFDKIFLNISQITLGGVDLEIVSVSAGIVMLTENKRTYEELMIEADTTLYQAKREGKNKYLFAEENISSSN